MAKKRLILVLIALSACSSVGEGHRPQDGGPGAGYYGYSTTTTLKPGSPKIP